MDDIDELIHNLDDGSADQPPLLVEEDESQGKNVPDNLLQTDTTNGLTLEEVARRRRTFGENELSEKRERNFIKFLMYFVGPVQYVMILAAILLVALRLFFEFGVILFLLLLNAVVGWIQEYKAGNVVAELRKTVADRTNVIRENGEVFDIPATEIVPGDIIPLEEGFIIPADGKIVNQGFLQVDQSPLTGESLTVEKRLNDKVFASSVVKRGEAVMIVTCIGDDTFVGVTASLVSGESKIGHFQKVLSNIAIVLLVLVLLFIAVIWVSGFFRSLPIITLLLYTAIITVIGVPVGLPAVVTTTMAVGAAELARKKVIVQKLAAIESLAGVDILCSDKTGTLTQNKLTMGTPYVVQGVLIEDLLLTSVLASSRKLRGLDPIDKTIILSLKQYPNVKETIKHFETVEFQPFDPVGKRVLSVVKDSEGTLITCVKGAPAAVLQMVQDAEDGENAEGTGSASVSVSGSEGSSSAGQLSQVVIDDYNKRVDDFAARGFRSLGVARKVGDGPWQILGILQLFDPPRYDTLQTIEEAKKLGLEIKMLTGDAVGIAKETSKQLNLGTKVYSIKKLISPDALGVRMTGSEINDFVEAADGFAEVFPQHKYMVVDILQKRGHLVAMTGDGVNDAPSLKKADTGIAVEGASPAARAAADIVFLNAGLSTIIDALKTSRQIFHRMRAYVVYRIALSIHLELFLVSTIVIFNTTINAGLVTILAIFADLATLAIAYDNATYSSRPTQWRLTNLWGTSVILGIVLMIGSWVAYGLTMLGPNRGIITSLGNAQAILFLEISLTQNWLIFITRCDGPFWASRPSWQLAGAVFVVDIIATVIAYFGWFSSSGTDIITIVKIWIFSFFVFVLMAIIHQWLNKSDIFDRFRHVRRDHYPHKFEDLMYNLERVAMMHEKNGNGNGNGNGHAHHHGHQMVSMNGNGNGRKK